MSLHGPRKCRAPGCSAPVQQSGSVGRTRETCSPNCKRRLSRLRAVERAATARSRSVEWYTPPEVFDWFVARWGPFHIDPCAAPKSPTSARFSLSYMGVDGWNGLRESWDVSEHLLDVSKGRGRAFVNPPYGRDDLPAWTTRCYRAVADGEVELAAMLIPLRPSSSWFQRSLERGATFEPLPKRVRFHELRPDGSVGPCSGALFECTALVFGDARMSRNR